MKKTISDYNTLCLLLFVHVFGIISYVNSQAPCGTSGLGFDPCVAEPILVATTCAGSEEVFRTNGCSGMNPTTSSCGLDAGANIVWGTFFVPEDDNITITWTASNNRNIRFGLYQYADECLFTGETEIACVNNGGNGVDETMTQFLTAGQYWVCCESSGNLSNASTICVVSPNLPPPIAASDCGIGVDICTNLNFTIDPNGEGANTNEIPPSGSFGNPYYDGSTPMPWGGTNMGCLQIDESNSTWMRVNVDGGGDLEFTFGGDGTQAGYYDWIMYPATSNCADIASDIVAPVRCNWNEYDYGGTGLADVMPVGGETGNFEPSLPVSAGEVYIICFSNYSSVQTVVPLSFGGTASISCLPLPVELAGMLIELSSTNEVHLDWSTASEHKNDYFVVERSVGEGAFEEVGKVQGVGMSTSESHYDFVDATPTEGEVNYYRLKQVDIDGVFMYTSVLSKMIPMSDVSVYPNPSKEIIHVQFGKEKEKHVSLLLRNVEGRIVQSVSDVNQHEKCTIDCSQLNEGIYLLEIIEDGNRSYTERIVIE